VLKGGLMNKVNLIETIKKLFTTQTVHANNDIVFGTSDLNQALPKEELIKSTIVKTHRSNNKAFDHSDQTNKGSNNHIRKLKATLSVVLLGCIVLISSSCSSNKSSSSSNTSSSTNGQSTGSVIKIPGKDAFCNLISATDLSQIMGASYPQPTLSASGGAALEIDCESDNSSGGTVSFELFIGDRCYNGQSPSKQCLSDNLDAYQTDLSLDQSNGSVQILTNLGEKAYCATKNVAGIPMAFVTVLNGWYRVGASTDTCTQGEALASLLLKRI
jgi:hypothetical protein